MTRGLALALAAALLLGGCSATGLVDRTFDPDVYTVQPGDTLYSIAWRYRLDPDDLARWNAIDQPEKLRVGRRIRLRPPQGDTPPAAEPSSASSQGGSATTAATPDSGSDAGAQGAATSDDGEQRVDGTEAASRPNATGDPGQWTWPTAGRLVGTFDDGRVAGRGIDIAGDVGQPVKATRPGKVVYSGDGLQAYGRLVIIRHANDYISAYAHNDEVLVREGDRVTGGQQIARMGKARDGGAILHFEIRRSGQPVDPLEYLPPRD